MNQLWVGVALACAVIGCNQTPDRGVVAENEGVLCLTAQPNAELVSVPGAQRIEDGQRLTVSVELDACLSSSCDVDREASCVIERQGKTLRVHSYLGYSSLDDAVCSRDCGRLIATCESEPLETGVYNVALGGEERALVVPSAADGPCL